MQTQSIYTEQNSQCMPPCYECGSFQEVIPESCTPCEALRKTHRVNAKIKSVNAKAPKSFKQSSGAKFTKDDFHNLAILNGFTSEDAMWDKIYVTDENSMYKVGEILGIAQRTVSTRLRKRGYEIRSREFYRGKKWRG